jgi:hypothetical protein
MHASLSLSLEEKESVSLISMCYGQNTTLRSKCTPFPWFESNKQEMYYLAKKRGKRDEQMLLAHFIQTTHPSM